MYFLLYFLFLIVQRLSELVISGKNELWLRSQGAIEYGKEHYPYIVALHILFIASTGCEYYLREGVHFLPAFLVIFFILLVLKTWVIASLGHYWNTKILRVPNISPIKKGPYRFFRHPNYIIVIAELFVVPMVFDLYITAIVFSVLNGFILYIRIKEENKVWRNE
ncbi:MAG: isoprenylcysteine carboxyl methyltransferase family protein [Bacteroidia bacterium]